MGGGCSSLNGSWSRRVLKNIAHLCSRTKSKTWGPDGWKKVVVCVVSDGRSKINKRTLQVLTLVSVLTICNAAAAYSCRA